MNLALPTDRTDDPGGQHRRLVCFVLGSLLLHLLLVSLWQGEPPAGPVGKSTFKVTLLARHGDTGSADKTGTAASATATANHRKPAASTENHRQEPGALTQYLAPLQPVTRAAARTGQGSGRKEPDVPAPQVRSPDRKDTRVADKVVLRVRARPAARSGSRTHGEHQLSSEAKYRRVQSALHQALLPVFEYPRLARRRGWQGRVTVGLYVEADGDLSRIRLIESSGYSLLDKEAVKNVTSLRNVPAVMQWLGGSDSSGMEVVLPVRYRLDIP